MDAGDESVTTTTAAMTTQPAGDGIGAMLRARREELGLTQADVASVVKLPPRRIDALECERWQELPDGTYLRGFLRNIARALDLDPATLLQRVDASVPGRDPERQLVAPGATTHVPLPRRSGPADDRRGGRAFVFGAFAFALIAAAIAWSGTDSFDRAMTAGRALIDARSGRAAPGPTEAPPTATASTVVESLAAPVGPTAAGPVAPATAATEATPVATPVVAAAPAVATAAEPLAVHVTADSWLEVRSGDGKVQIRRNVTAGTDQTFDGPAPFTVVVGNTTGVALRFRGQPVDLGPYTKGQVARFTLS